MGDYMKHAYRRKRIDCSIRSTKQYMLTAVFLFVCTVTVNITKLIRTGGIDKNASTPYFDRAIYEANVDENAQLQHTVLVVNAKDKHDISLIRYEITSGNVGDAFEVDNATGAIYLVAPLDYEVRKRYDLRLAASNSKRKNYTSVIINVNDVNDNPPVFERSSFKVQITEEDDVDLPKSILKVQATDADVGRPQSIVYFLSGQGIDSEFPDNSKFQINCTSGEVYVMKSLNRDLPTGRAQWKFTVFARDENGEGLVGYADIQVTLRDINDNAPIFAHSTYHGYTSENGLIGDFVIKLFAEDYDDPLENSNAKIVYSIEKNVIDHVSDLSIFSIGADSGIIQTEVCCLDREHARDYAIQVVATDGGGLKGTCTVSIHIIDVNDNSPYFTKDEWYVEVNETMGVDLPDAAILTVTVQDDDEDGTNDFYYQILDNSGLGTDNFKMARNIDGSGALKVVKPLDYENPLQRRGFRFKIFVNDKGERNDLDKDHVAYSWIVITLRDINDNEPKFVQKSLNVVVSENVEIGLSVASFLATDADNSGYSKVSYAIERSTDEKMQFAINKNGIVCIESALDREVMPIHRILILAIDEGSPSKSGTATLVVTVDDINDNAPKFIKDYRVVIQENNYPGRMIELFAFDPDDRIKGNGPPFFFSIDRQSTDIIREAFSVEQVGAGANGEGSALVSSLVSFDREYQKEYHIPITIRDSGRPPMTGTSTLTVIIGDVNDNEMKPGAKVITVYNNFAMQSIYVNIGTVFVNDPDDWDLTDKRFYWNGVNHPRFKLDSNTGMLSMKQGTRIGNYQLQFKVFDLVHMQHEVDANVLVKINELSMQDVENAGSLRILGVSDEDFIRIWNYKSKLTVKSRLEKFKNAVGDLLKVEREDVHVFSVQSKSQKPVVTDIRFSVRFFNAVHLNYIIRIHRKRIENEVGVNITMVNINECLYDVNKCNGHCTSKFEISALPHLVNANMTSMVCIRVDSIPVCECATRSFWKKANCRNYSCYNGGKCVDTLLGVRCLCSAEYSGSRCQLTSRSFYGNGWALVKALEFCQDSHIHFEFITNKAHGLLLYNGPITTKPIDEISNKLLADFISIELENGYPRLLVDFGSGTIELYIYTKQALNDGEWHRIDIFLNDENVRMVVDFCKTADFAERDGIHPHLNKTSCEIQKKLLPNDKLLNINTPLQIGGLSTENFDPLIYHWKFIPTLKAFSGCIRNIHHNSILFDLGNSALSMNSVDGCTIMNKRCSNSTALSECSKHGYCDGSFGHSECKCNPGWTGTTCKIPTISIAFKPQSFVKYSLKFNPHRYATVIQLRFRSRERHGELFRLTDQSGLVYQILEIKNSRLVFRYNLNYIETSEYVICLSAITVDDGQWHNAHVNRHGSAAILKVDGGEGLLVNGSYSFDGPQWLVVDVKEGVYAGGIAIQRNENTTDVFADFHNGCLNDIRLDGKPLPLPPAVNETQWALATNLNNVENGCMLNSSCLEVICSKSLKCADFWNKNNCICNEEQVVRADTRNCANSDDCLKIVCADGGSCQEPILHCCLDGGIQGDSCTFQNGQALKLGVGTLSAILSSVLIFLVFVLYNRRRLDPVKPKRNKDIRENIITYDEAGNGTGDMTTLDTRAKMSEEKFKADSSQTNVSIEVYASEWVESKKERIDEHVVSSCSFDDLRNYAYEGGGCSDDSLSSLELDLECTHQSHNIL